MNFRQRIGAAISMAGLVTMSVGLLAAPSFAAADVNECKAAFEGKPPGALAISSDPADGANVEPGDVILIEATWDDSEWLSLDKILACVKIDGEIASDLSSELAEPNLLDESYTHEFTVPDAVDSTVCVRARLSGDPNPEFAPQDDNDEFITTQKSNEVCFTVVAASTPPPVDNTPPPVDNTPPPGDTVITNTEVAGNNQTQAPATSGGSDVAATQTQQAPAAEAAEVLGLDLQQPAALAELPRTGSTSPVLLLVAGIALLLGGLAIGLGQPASRRPVAA